jgi:hypothetical protein
MFAVKMDRFTFFPQMYLSPSSKMDTLTIWQGKGLTPRTLCQMCSEPDPATPLTCLDLCPLTKDEVLH